MATVTTEFLMRHKIEVERIVRAYADMRRYPEHTLQHGMALIWYRHAYNWLTDIAGHRPAEIFTMLGEDLSRFSPKKQEHKTS